MRICTKFVLLLYSKMKCSQSYSLNKISAWRQFMYRAIRTVSDPLFIIEVAHNKIWHCTLSSFFHRSLLQVAGIVQCTNEMMSADF